MAIFYCIFDWKSKNKWRKSTAIFFFFTIGLAAILTNSRNAWVGILLSITLLLNVSNLYWILPILFFLSFLIAITSSELFTGELQESFRTIIPDKIWMEFTQKVELTRFDIILSSFKISLVEPIFGLGGASFPIIYELQNNIWRGHTHNLILELAVSYGYPVTILIFFGISFLLIKSRKIIFSNKLQNDQFFSFEKAWWVSAFVFILSQSVDVQYYDGRISILFWVLLAGLKTILEEKIKET